ncbi:hypothetical protein H6F87_26375 [Cyanobacteria bacterium FACHB-502]|uniref:hypothetical protein n=1 Tax=Leptolyngbya sp. GB1-A1 TaxID=2933908 RepID=UPI0019976CE1|nr:hypothetical protein [Cyanobacteria bacterium FACHB-502]
MDNFDLPYSEYLNRGRAWSPSWTANRHGFDCWLVFAPPGVAVLESPEDYFMLLSRRLQHQIEIWLDQYSDELPVSVDREDPEAVWDGTLQMVRQYFPLELSTDQSVREVAQAIAQATVPPLSNTQFPVELPLPEPDEDFGACLEDESTFKGWLIEAS